MWHHHLVALYRSICPSIREYAITQTSYKGLTAPGDYHRPFLWAPARLASAFWWSWCRWGGIEKKRLRHRPFTGQKCGAAAAVVDTCTSHLRQVRYPQWEVLDLSVGVFCRQPSAVWHYDGDSLWAWFISPCWRIWRMIA